MNEPLDLPSPDSPENPHDRLGRFKKGHKGQRNGNPTTKAEAIRKSILRKADKKIYDTIADRLIEAACDGERWAVKEFYDRTAGISVSMETKQRLESLERAVAQRVNGGRNGN